MKNIMKLLQPVEQLPKLNKRCKHILQACQLFTITACLVAGVEAGGLQMIVSLSFMIHRLMMQVTMNKA